MKVRAVGYHLIVRPDDIETVSKGGIIIPEDKRYKDAQEVGIVLEVGRLCWKREEIGKDGEHVGVPWCKEGDRVIFAKYTGQKYTDADTAIEYRIINDTDVVAVIEE